MVAGDRVREGSGPRLEDFSQIERKFPVFPGSVPYHEHGRKPLTSFSAKVTVFFP